MKSPLRLSISSFWCGLKVTWQVTRWNTSNFRKCFYLNICPSSRNLRHALFIWHKFGKWIITFVQPTQGIQTLLIMKIYTFKVHTWVQSSQEPTNTTNLNIKPIFNFKSSNPWAFDMFTPIPPILVEYLWNLYRKEHNQVWCTYKWVQYSSTCRGNRLYTSLTASQFIVIS